MTFALTFSILALLQAQPPPLPVVDLTTVIQRFHQVDDKLYRGAQPDAGGFHRLKDLQIRTVIDLRSEADEGRRDEQKVVESLGMRYVSLPIADGNFFKRAGVVPEGTIRKFFAALDASAGPVFVHCRRGADRTGTVVALYRIARHGWDNQRAYAEARAVGMRSWYTGFRQQILAFRPGPEVAVAAPRQ